MYGPCPARGRGLILRRRVRRDEAREDHREDVQEVALRLASLISIVRASSSTVMPLMSPFFVFANCSAPTMPVKKPTPGESIRKSRLIVAEVRRLTGVPSEYFKPSAA